MDNYTYNLGPNARICGVNSLADIGTEKSPECNLQPAQLVITQTGESEKGSCPTNAERDDFIFEGATFRSMHKQIGNAVPVLLAERIAKKIKQVLISKSISKVA